MFHEELEAIGKLHDSKQADYGRENDPFANVRASDEFGIEPWIGCMVRANDKMRRIQTYAKKNSLKHESVEDSMRDLAVYALISLCLYKESVEKKRLLVRDDSAPTGFRPDKVADAFDALAVAECNALAASRGEDIT
jgi:hypothetical protein